jgi:hypothetical protein
VGLEDSTHPTSTAEARGIDVRNLSGEQLDALVAALLDEQKRPADPAPARAEKNRNGTP